jgi:U-box domain
MDDRYLCPITMELMHDPVLAADGFTYDRTSIEAWFRFNPKDTRSPKTNEPIDKHLMRSFEYYTTYKEWCAAHGHPEPAKTTAFGLISAPPALLSVSPGFHPLPVLYNGTTFTLRSLYYVPFVANETLESALSSLARRVLVGILEASFGLVVPPTRDDHWLTTLITWLVEAHHYVGATTPTTLNVPCLMYVEHGTTTCYIRMHLPTYLAYKVYCKGYDCWKGDRACPLSSLLGTLTVLDLLDVFNYNTNGRVLIGGTKAMRISTLAPLIMEQCRMV